MNKITLSYIAGIIDGEGCISIEKYKIPKIYRTKNNEWRDYFRPKIEVLMTNPKAIHIISKTFGNSVWQDNWKEKTGIGKTRFRWAARGRNVLPILKNLLPYLTVKKEQALVAIKLAKQIKPKGGKHPTRKTFIKQTKIKTTLYIKMKSLNI